ncbi:DnaD domain protein [Staphylococcus haemolyticus]|uniref:DnaD domain protein n=1 Tax=Staphylococcus haemolyticus TaxID=1283 RepID=UPI001C1EBF21|nr:DnaD domain protein [Staphylococcus haemolyticus]MBU6948704.1 DnaD domain protein [Staphylococcus haemolyticus]MBU7211535.1 DnaD domain protein [Staphylococcus haemolyticus]
MSDRLIDITGGYGTVYKEVLKDKNLSVEAKAIYSYLSSYAGGKDTAFPSIGLICHELNISEKRFYKHRKELLDKNIISKTRERTNNGFSKTIYTINHHFVHGQFVRVRNVHGQNVHGQNVGTKNNNNKNNNNKNNNNKSDTSQIFQLVSKELEMIQSPLKVQELEDELNLIKENKLEITGVAINYCKQNKKGINYLIKVLRNWNNEGVDTKEKALDKVTPKKKKSNETDDLIAAMERELGDE